MAVIERHESQIRGSIKVKFVEDTKVRFEKGYAINCTIAKLTVYIGGLK